MPAANRSSARRQVERILETAVLDVLGVIDLVALRVVALRGYDDEPPAIALFCDSVGQIDLGWIETSDAPIAWRAAAYRTLERTLGIAVPIFGYQDLFEQISSYYWEGATDDDDAREALIKCHGADPDEVDGMGLPSEMGSRRPAWMIAANAASGRALPPALRGPLRTLKAAYRALRRVPTDGNAWWFDTATLYDYLPGLEESSCLPPMTLVPVDHFESEVDDVGRQGMEMGFMDVSGLCPLATVEQVDGWLASLRVGVEFLAAAQALIRLDPTNL